MMNNQLGLLRPSAVPAGSSTAPGTLGRNEPKTGAGEIFGTAMRDAVETAQASRRDVHQQQALATRNAVAVRERLTSDAYTARAAVSDSMRGQRSAASETAAAAADVQAGERGGESSVDRARSVSAENEPSDSTGEAAPVTEAPTNSLAARIAEPEPASVQAAFPLPVADEVDATNSALIPPVASSTSLQTLDVPEMSERAAVAPTDTRADASGASVLTTVGGANATQTTAGGTAVATLAATAPVVRAAVPMATTRGGDQTDKAFGAAAPTPASTITAAATAALLAGSAPALAVNPDAPVAPAPARDTSTASATVPPVLATATGAAVTTAVPLIGGDAVTAPSTAPAANVAVVMPAPASLSAATAVAPVAATAPQPPALAAQVTRALFTLVGVAPGEHTMVVKVTPENLGPLTVRAHITPDGMRLELFAPTEQSREALRALLPDLRRDVSGFGANAQLDLSSENEPEHTDRGSGDDRPGERRPGGSETDAPRTSSIRTLPSALFGPTSTIDVLA
ncbi:flagellar hook-length control protein FliK [Cryobacterium sp. Hh7]|uniref:flagellar hook-length control protein FliK n=1 Tax=Cryobacterium sp. Hh7 TaxID=1259159 RepID=UPI00106C9AAD|nr:flagellar hook-length control protein FliK [Cryobacterium sp. Hh7]TFD58586.1 flagellar hook-length control protein FliK [Cryobacterium sp. Hh7]